MSNENNPVKSALSRSVTVGTTTVQIDIYRGEGGWHLEVVDQFDEVTAWGESFATEQEALEHAMKTIQEEGIDTFASQPTRQLH